MLGFPVLRLRGDYLAIVTLAFGEIIRIVLINWVSLTNGPNGITGIPRPTLFGLAFSMDGGDGTFAGFFNIEPATDPAGHLPLLRHPGPGAADQLGHAAPAPHCRWAAHGRHCARTRSPAARWASTSRNTKLTAFAIGAMFGGFAGAFFATRQAFISPESFTFIESPPPCWRSSCSAASASQLGVALAAIVMVGGLEVLRDFLSFLGDQMNSPVFAGIASELPLYRMLIFGLALVVMMVLRPRGLVSGRTPTWR